MKLVVLLVISLLGSIVVNGSDASSYFEKLLKLGNSFLLKPFQIEIQGKVYLDQVPEYRIQKMEPPALDLKCTDLDLQPSKSATYKPEEIFLDDDIQFNVSMKGLENG